MNLFPLSRRDLIKSGLAASTSTLLPGAVPYSPPSETPQNTQVERPVAASVRERLSMDHGWKFALGNACDPAKDFNYGRTNRERLFAKSGNIVEATSKFNDTNWRVVDLPHDWAEDLPFIAIRPTQEQGAKPLGREFPETSIGWYRKTFSLSAADAGKRIQMQFDGIYRDATVLLNGHYIAENFSGYAPFVLDVTDWISFTEPNILTIRVDATLGDGWFYEGAGIYRHVWLIKSDPVYLVEWGTYVRPQIKGSSATIQLGSEVRNASGQSQQVVVLWELGDPSGNTVGHASSEAKTLAADEVVLLTGETVLQSMKLWSIETPLLYRAIASIQCRGSVVDSDETKFGIRQVQFDPDKGFYLNGQQVKIKGTCCHQDHAGLGVALPDRVQFYRIERLKSMGSNGLRTTHNPPTPELLDATDALGMLVMCENRMMDSSAEGLSQLERMVRRFRNHPSIVIWSLGNEEPEQGTERGQRIVTTMQRLAHRLDPTRLCTVAMNSKEGTGISGVVDVQGFNYSDNGTIGFHKNFPRKPVIGTETASTISTRGIYENDKVAGYVSAYDINKPNWGNTAEEWWSFYDEHEFLAGGFAWTGFDYRGEPTPYGFPCVSSHFGIMDTCGFPKDNYFYYKAWWGNDPVLHLFPHWNWPSSMIGKEVSVWCHSNLDSVELFLNGRSLGIQQVVRNKHLEWRVKYQPGTIEARGTRGKRIVLKQMRETTGAPAKIVLNPDRSTLDANGTDVSMIAIEVQDAEGRTMPTANNDIEFKVSGAGRLLGMGNGDPSSHESDKDNHRKTFNGWAQAVVQSLREPGNIAVTATSPGLTSATIILTSRAVKSVPSV